MINAAGLVGTVTAVAADAAVVTLIDDPTPASRRVDNTSREFGIGPGQGNPGELVTLGGVQRPGRSRSET